MIGNSDDKLTQREWAEFCADLLGIIEHMQDGGELYARHGIWYSAGFSPFQNMAICVTVPDEYVETLRGKLIRLAKQYRQDSIAVLAGRTAMICPD